MAMLYDGPYSTEFYHRVHAALHTEFRIRKATRGSGVVRTALNLTRAGRVKAALSLIRDVSVLPLRRMVLQRARRRSKHSPGALPALLNRDEAGTPSPDHEP